MRVSNNQLIGSSIQAMQQQGADALKYQQQIASGNRFAKASEGAVELARGVQLQFEKSRYEMLKRNQDVVATRAALTYTQLDTMTKTLLSLQEIAARATFPGLDSAGLSALHAEASVALDTLTNLSKSMSATGGGSSYLVPGLTAPQLSQPQMNTGSDAATLGDSAIFSRHGTYTIDGYNAANESVRLQIDGVGPDGTSSTYFIGSYDGAGSFTFPQFPGVFQNLVLTPSVAPTDTSAYEFTVPDVGLSIGPDSRFYDAGSYEVVLTDVSASDLGAELHLPDGTVVPAQGFTTNGSALTLDFGDVVDSGPPIVAHARTVTLTVSGDRTGLQDNDKFSFTALENASSLPVEPGLSLPEGLHYSEVMRRSGATQDILTDVKKFVDELGGLTAPISDPSADLSSYSDLVNATSHIMSERTRIGSIAAQVDIARSSLESKGVELDNSHARLLETDVAEASTRLVRAQTLLQAAQSIFSRLESSNLFQRLG